MSTSQALMASYFAIAEKSPEQQVLDLLLALGTQVVGADNGALLALKTNADGSQSLVFLLSSGDTSLHGKEVPLGQGITGMAAATREVQIGSPTYGGVHVAGADAPKYVMAAPMLMGDELIGVITAATFKEGKHFGRDDALLFMRIASVAALVIRQRRQLDAVEALQAAPDTDAPLREEERLERAVITSVGRLVRAAPDKLPEIAALVLAVEKVCGTASR
jgi:GAF domain-containing protein